MPRIAIAGYTNSGKSTLLNFITQGKSRIYADDKLFATLDPTTRRVVLPGGGTALFTDTVGFIQKLPHDLVAAFRSTLEEIAQADCILHVHDSASANLSEHRNVVTATLKDLGAGKIPVINVYNKTDLLPASALSALSAAAGDSAALISCITGDGIREMLKLVGTTLSLKWKHRTVMISYQDAGLLEEINRSGLITEIRHIEKGLQITFMATDENWTRFSSKYGHALHNYTAV